MSEEIPSGWVPDKLPEFRSRSIPVTINDPRLAEETLKLSSSLGIEPIELGRKFVTLGLIAAKSEEDLASTLVERDSMGREKIVHLMDQSYPVGDETTEAVRLNYPSTYTGRKLVFSMPGVLADEFMEIANRHQTTVDDVLRKMFILGIKVGNVQNDTNISYILKNKKGSDERFTL